MLRQSKDLYTISVTDRSLKCQFEAGGTEHTIGRTEFYYEVVKYVDIKNLKESHSYIVTCTQRMIIPNKGDDIGNITTFTHLKEGLESFFSYPVFLSNTMNIDVGANATALLRDYFPKTLNSNVQTDVNNSDSSSSSFSRTHTSGNTTTDTNSFGVSLQLGGQGDTPTGGLGLNYEHSDTTTKSNETAKSASSDTSHNLSSSSSMSIKDWGSYASLGLGLEGDENKVHWTWMQEYPWADYGNFDSNLQLFLPDYIEKKIFLTSDNKGSANTKSTAYSVPTIQSVTPPTQISNLGGDFTSKASWVVTFDAGYGTPDITFDHLVRYKVGSHGVDDNHGAFVVSTPMDENDTTGMNFTSPSLDLPLLALDPINKLGAQNGAVVGFVNSRFLKPPTPGSHFEIVSGDNNLLVRGEGFDEDMIADLTTSDGKIDIYFKVLDPNASYMLYMKCWKNDNDGVDLQITINDNVSFNKLIDFKEGEGGEDNIMSLILRNKDYTSLDYHDYLQMGYNKISIVAPKNLSITPPYSFQVRALSIE